MRWVISGAAFFVPLMAVIAIGGSCVGSHQPETTLAPAQVGELRKFTRDREDLLDRYAVARGQPESPSIPHLALERFDRRGNDARGNAWYRLARTPPGLSAGVVRPVDATGLIQVAGGATPSVVLPLTQRWRYWEVRSPTAPARISP
jgi:hypothetical protein